MILKHADIVCEDKIIKRGYLKIKDGRIIDIGEHTDEEGLDLSGHTIMSGFIDTHVHGTDTYDAMDGTTGAIENISKHLTKEGTTTFCATTMTMDQAAIENALTAIRDAQVDGAKLAGVHLEGPFINEDFKGAQNAKHIVKGSKALFDHYQTLSGNNIKIVTLAPEKQEQSFLSHLVNQGVIVSMGHTSTDTTMFKKAHALGIKRVTHCFNAMPKIHHRDLGLAGMALLYDDVMVEAIVDFVHLSEETVQLIVKNKPEDKISLITDSIRAKNLKDGRYDLGGQDVEVKDGVARIKDSGAIAGSVLRLNDAVKNLHHATHKSLIQVSKMASLNPAKELGIADVTGSIETGKKADIVVLDAGFNVQMTLVDGVIKYQQ